MPGVCAASVSRTDGIVARSLTSIEFGVERVRLWGGKLTTESLGFLGRSRYGERRYNDQMQSSNLSCSGDM